MAPELEMDFLTPERFAHQQSGRLESPRGPLLIAGCRSGSYLAGQVFRDYRERLADQGAQEDGLYLENIDGQFSDSETFVRLERNVSGFDVYLFQALLDPLSGRSIDENYMAFLIAARAFVEWGANHVTGVLPYLAYARQDKPTREQREPTTANLLADLSSEAGIDRLVTWHPHSPQIQGFYDQIPVVKLASHALFRRAFQRFEDRPEAIMVAPDAGASKFVTLIGRQMNLNAAIASKYRPKPEQAVINEVIGDFSGKTVAIVLDDMISSGGTVYALVQELVQNKGIQEVYLGASHNLCTPVARQRLLELHADYGLQEVIVTNSIPQTEAFLSLPFLKVWDLAPTLSFVVNQIHYNRPVDESFYHPS